MRIAEFALKNAKGIFAVTLALILAGFAALFDLPRAIYPEVAFSRVVIIAEEGTLSPDNMILQVVRPIEENISYVLGTQRIRSKTIRGSTEISIQYAPGTNMVEALQDVRGRVADVLPSLPPLESLVIERLTPSVFPIMIWNLSGPMDPAELRDFAYYDLRPRLLKVSGVGVVKIDASDVREIHATVDPEKMLARNLSLPKIEEAIKSTNIVKSVGKLYDTYKEYMVLSTGLTVTPDEVSNIVVGAQNGSPVFLKDVAVVEETIADRTVSVRGSEFGGQRAVAVNIFQQIGGNTIQITEAVKKEIEEIKKDLPPGVQMIPVRDESWLISSSVKGLWEAIVVGAILAAFILFLFLREARTSLIAVASIPIVALITFFLMKLAGETFNLMSLGGLAVAIGLVVDDAIVVVENILRHVQLGHEERKSAIITGTREILGAVTGSTLTTVGVFAPLAFVEGMVGQFFKSLSLTLTMAVLTSLVVAVVVVPAFAGYFMRGANNRRNNSAHAKISLMADTYARMLEWSLNHKAIIAVLLVLFPIAAILIYPHVGTGFLPEVDEGSFILDYLTPFGTSLEHTDKSLLKIEDVLRNTPGVVAYSRRTGTELGFFATDVNNGDILVRLAAENKRDKSCNEIIDEVRTKVESSVFGFISVEFRHLLEDLLADLEGESSPIEIKIFGDDLQVLKEHAQKVSEQVAKVPGVVDLFNGIFSGAPEITVKVDPVSAARAGLTVEQVSEQVNASMFGTIATKIPRHDRFYNLRLRLPAEYRHDLGHVRQIPIVSPNGGSLPLEALANIEITEGQLEQLRENMSQMTMITAGTSERDLGSIITDVKNILANYPLPEGYHFELGGLTELQQRAFKNLLFVMIGGIVIIFIMLVFQFRSFAQAILILVAVPLSAVGFLFTLWITGTPLNISSFMGIILLVGLEVKNRIIFVSYENQLRRERGCSLREALVMAGKVRLRPVLMTSFATLLALLPLALRLGTGADMQRPLAIAVIGGLFASLVLTLIFVPVAYEFINGLLSRWTKPQSTPLVEE